MRLDKPPSISSIKAVFGSLSTSEEITTGNGLAKWAEVVGPKIAEQAHDVYFQGSVLTCVVMNAVWRHEIHANRFQITKRLNDAVDHKVVQELKVVAK